MTTVDGGALLFSTLLSTDAVVQAIERKTSPSVIVIGGGMAGIAAARFLHDASIKVVLLESRDRLGGRVHTDYTFGFPVDMGASWLHGVCDKNPLAPLIGRLGLPLYRTSGDNSVLYDHDLQSYALFDVDGNQVPHDLVRKVGETFEELLQEASHLRNEITEDMSVAHALSIVLQRKPSFKLEGTAQRVLQWHLSRLEGWFAADSDTISLASWDQEELLPGGHGLMVGGYLPLVNNLAEGLDIRMRHSVTEISRRYNGVMVTVEDGRSFVADAAIIALPLGVLKGNGIKFDPNLPEWKQIAISELGVGLLNKIVLRFEEVFWPDVEFLGVIGDTAYCCSYFLSLHKATGHPVLVYMPAGQLAKEIEKMSDQDACKFAFDQLKKILPSASDPVQYLVSHWGTNIHSLGSYTYDMVGKGHDLYEKLSESVENLFFAGEATSVAYPGSVHGAYASGVSTAALCKMHVLQRELGAFEPLKGEEEPLKGEEGAELDVFEPLKGDEVIPIQISRQS